MLGFGDGWLRRRDLLMSALPQLVVLGRRTHLLTILEYC
jgi:hypothetical protein